MKKLQKPCDYLVTLIISIWMSRKTLTGMISCSLVKKVEVHGNENKTLEILRHELKKEQDVVEVRLRSYLAGRHNLNSGLKFNELEFTIAHGLLKECWSSYYY